VSIAITHENEAELYKKINPVNRLLNTIEKTTNLPNTVQQ